MVVELCTAYGLAARCAAAARTRARSPLRWGASSLAGFWLAYAAGSLASAAAFVAASRAGVQLGRGGEDVAFGAMRVLAVAAAVAASALVEAWLRSGGTRGS